MTDGEVDNLIETEENAKTKRKTLRNKFCQEVSNRTRREEKH